MTTSVDAPTFVAPPPLHAGDTIAVVAPASPFPDSAFFAGLAWLRQRHPILVRSSIRSRQGYLAGDDERRAEELSHAMTDPRVRAIFCARGGYGVMRIVDRLPWDAFARDPKWLIGFSDITALHAEATARGIMSLHGPNVTGLSVASPPLVRHDVLTLLAGSARGRPFSSLRTLHRGHARGPDEVISGPAVGGNLAMLAAMAGAGRLAFPRNAVLFLEDVTERPYRVDRMLTTLRLGGHLRELAAIVFGDFTACDPGPDGVTVDEVQKEATAHLRIPVLAGAPIGHDATNRPILLGQRAFVEGSTVSFADR